MPQSEQKPTPLAPGSTVTIDHFERVMSALMDQMETRDRDLTDRLQQSVERGVVAGMQAMIADDERVKKFWRKGYEEITQHGRDDVSRGIGKRVLTWVSGVLFSVAIYLAIKAGYIK